MAKLKTRSNDAIEDLESDGEQLLFKGKEVELYKQPKVTEFTITSTSDGVDYEIEPNEEVIIHRANIITGGGNPIDISPTGEFGHGLVIFGGGVIHYLTNEHMEFTELGIETFDSAFQGNSPWIRIRGTYSGDVVIKYTNGDFLVDISYEL